jgi:hypothetical protein
MRHVQVQFKRFHHLFRHRRKLIKVIGVVRHFKIHTAVLSENFMRKRSGIAA